jgi:multiple antibiotic resistance protein
MSHLKPKANQKSWKMSLQREYRVCPTGDAQYGGARDDCDDHQLASTVRDGSTFSAWVVLVAPPLIFALIGVILWGSLRSSGAIMRWVGKGGIEAISRLMGFLLVCMGVQFIINGVLEIIKTYH